MFGLVVGAITGGLITWYWGDRIRGFAADNMTGARKSTADRLRWLAETTAGPFGPLSDEHAGPVALVTLSRRAQRAKAWLA